MMKEPSIRSSRRPPSLWTLCVLSCLFVGLILPWPAGAVDKFDPDQAGHPLRVVGYLFHPVGVVLEYAIARPAFFVVKREPFSTIFGYERPWEPPPPEAPHQRAEAE